MTKKLFMIRTRIGWYNLLLGVGLATFLQSCNLAPKEEETPTVKADTINQINFFLETSASMGGYLNGSTEFKNIVSEFANKLSQIEPVRKPLALYTISTEAQAYPGDVDKFVTSLATVPLANARSSELHTIFRQVGEKARNNSVALLVSDCILSFPDEDIKKNPQINATDASSVLKNEINRQFAQLSKDTINATVYAFSSAFNGTYYDYQNKKQKLNGESRPFYIWVIGKQRVLNLFNQKLQATLTTKPDKQLDFGGTGTITDYDLFYTLNRKGENWNADEPRITNLKGVRTDRPAEFAIGVNLSGLPSYAQTEAYLTKNLNVSAGNAGVKLLRIEPKDAVKDTEKLKTNEAKMLSEATHVLTFRVTQLFEPKTPVTIKLPVRYDTWYLNQSTMDDRTATGREGKTFALEHLMNGVRDAYETRSGNDKSFLQLNLTLEQ
ncbi:hypothetical protein [Spirosoma oryzicola]|uniref:hypothetical protein n=1 Tax=Spirosoma oryzicola TaxID=2898794 RepID=UPI001E319AC7|nr:hypothetical protein [Spirosoma oryzicola]UHG89942.1 hypothetical protein LQ777_17010 [Spirosoma oryzicola]